MLLEEGINRSGNENEELYIHLEGESFVGPPCLSTVTQKEIQ